VIWAAISLVLVASLQGQESSILTDIEALDKSLAHMQAQVAQDKVKRDVAHLQLQQIEAAAERSRQMQAQAWQQLQRRIRALASLPATTPLALWQNGTTFAETLADMRLLRHIAAHDRSLHQTLVQKRDALAGLEIERQNQQAQFDAQAQQSQGRLDALLAQRASRRALLASIRSRTAAKAKLGDETQAARAALGAMVQAPQGPQSLSGAPSGAIVTHLAPTPAPQAQQAAGRLDTSHTTRRLSAHKGDAAWPAAGPVRVAFGERIDLAYGTITAHNGWDIGAPMGSRVQAIGPGRIVYADWLRGYGQVVIIDHHDALHAVVAHLASIDVRVGERVEPGQSLGTVGDTGSLRGPVLYFELRHKGAPVDPKAWLRR
jgi:septal ring factor EnvC (AmiA/AmiB activator)